MSFDWSEYLILAQELTSTSINSPIQEAHLRAAISRAYTEFMRYGGRLLEAPEDDA